MAMTEQEELELLELEKEQAMSQQPPAEPPKTFMDGVKDTSKSIINGLPEAAGMIVGGIVGAPLGPVGAVAGAGLGAAGAHELKQGIKTLTGNMAPRSAKQAALEALSAGAEGAGAEMGGQLIGKGIEAAAPVVTKGIGKISDTVAKALEGISTGAKRRAFGFTRGQIGKSPEALAAADDASKTVFDNAKISNTDNAVDMMGKVQGVQDKAGKGIGEVYNSLDKSKAKSFNPVELADEIEAKLKPPTPATTGGADDATMNSVDEVVNTILGKGSENLSFNEAHGLVQRLQELGRFEGLGSASDSAKAKLYQRASGIAKQFLQKSVEKSAGSDALGALRNNNSLFNKSDSVIDALTKKQASEATTKAFGMKDWISGGVGGVVGAVTGTPGGAGVGAIAGPLISRSAEKFGNQTMANSVDYIAGLVKKSPQMFGKYGPVLSTALQKSPQAFAVAHFLLGNQDPNYRKMIGDIDEQKEQSQ